MKLASFEAIVHALNRANVRFIVVGGLAVNAHGYFRFTNDVDLVIQLSKRDIIPALIAMKQTVDPKTASILKNCARSQSLRGNKNE